MGAGEFCLNMEVANVKGGGEKLPRRPQRECKLNDDCGDIFQENKGFCFTGLILIGLFIN